MGQGFAGCCGKKAELLTLQRGCGPRKGRGGRRRGVAGKGDGTRVRFSLHLLGGRPGHLCLTPLLHWTVGQGERSHSPGQQRARKESWGQGSAAPTCVGKPGTQGHQCPGAILFQWGCFAPDRWWGNTQHPQWTAMCQKRMRKRPLLSVPAVTTRQGLHVAGPTPTAVLMWTQCTSRSLFQSILRHRGCCPCTALAGTPCQVGQGDTDVTESQDGLGWK